MRGRVVLQRQQAGGEAARSRSARSSHMDFSAVSVAADAEVSFTPRRVARPLGSGPTLDRLRASSELSCVPRGDEAMAYFRFKAC